MARLVGIEISPTHARAAVLVTAYRKTSVERVVEVDLRDVPSRSTALHDAFGPLLGHGEGLAVAVDGSQVFVSRLSLPATAVQKLEMIVPFELESRLPLELEELVFDHQLIRERGANETVRVLAVASRERFIREILDLCRTAFGREAERVGCGALPLVNLLPLYPKGTLSDEPIALLDLGLFQSEILVVSRGEPVFSRTLSIGVAGLPAEAAQLAAAVRQTLHAAAALDDAPISLAYLLGTGAGIEGAEAFLSHELGLSVLPLPPLTSLGVTEQDQPRFARAIGVALGLGTRPRDPDLRQGALSFQRGYAVVKDKAPVLLGLAVSILLSLGFSSWASLRSLDKEHSSLTANLAQLTHQTLGEEATDADSAKALLERKLAVDELDPMPHADAFDVMVEIANAVPSTITHDIDELDVQREHVKLTGIVGSAAEAQQVATKLKEHRCFTEVRLGNVTQVVNSTRQKYGLEWDVRCPEDASAKKKKSDEKAADKSGGSK